MRISRETLAADRASLVADPVVLSLHADVPVPNASALAEDEDITALALAVPAPECDDNTTRSRNTESDAEKTILAPQTDAIVEERKAIDIRSGSDQTSSSPEFALAEAVADSAPEQNSAGSSPATNGDTEKTPATENLLQIAAGARPFRRPDGQYSVSIAVNGHHECHALQSPEVVRWLTRNYYESAGRLPSSASLATTIRALATHADIAGTAEADFVRVGCNQSGSSIFLDLGDSTWRAIEIQATGWHVVNRPERSFSASGWAAGAAGTGRSMAR